MDRFSETFPSLLGLREPFFTQAEPCEVCGEPCSELTYIKEHQLYIGTDCGCNSPDDPLCLEAFAIMQKAKSVAQLLETIKEHVSTCPLCRETPVRKDAGRETLESIKDRRVA